MCILQALVTGWLRFSHVRRHVKYIITDDDHPPQVAINDPCQYAIPNVPCQTLEPGGLVVIPWIVQIKPYYYHDHCWLQELVDQQLWECHQKGSRSTCLDTKLPSPLGCSFTLFSRWKIVCSKWWFPGFGCRAGLARVASDWKRQCFSTRCWSCGWHSKIFSVLLRQNCLASAQLWSFCTTSVNSMI